MPTKVKNIVEGHRVIDNERVAEDVTSITLPTIKNKTSTISASGMVMDVDMPNLNKLEAMEISIAHNNGVNCGHLADPGKHSLEFRLARQNYNVAQGVMEHESVKYRINGLHKETDKGKIEDDNPLGYTDKYSVMRYEEEVAGEIVTIIDAAAGIIKINGVDYSNEVESLL